MANRKASLGTAHRRHPPLRAASPALAGTAPKPLAARRDVRAATLIAETIAAATVLQPATAAPHQAERGDRDSIDAKLVQLVGSHKRVLVIGRDTWALSRSLSSAGSRVSVVETCRDVPAGSVTFSDRVVVGDPDTLDLEHTLEDAPFDAVVVVQLIEHVRSPVKTLATLRKHLSAEGCLIAAVPNIMHGSIRLAFLAGHSPADLVTSDGASPSHWYDCAAMQRTFDRAGFMITRIERQTETFESDRAVLDGTPLPREIVAGLMKDADAMTAAFVVVAHPFPLTGRVLVEMRVRQLAETHDRLLQQTQELAQRVEGLDTGYGDLRQIVDGAVRKLDRIASDLECVTAGDSGLQPSLAAAEQRLSGERVNAEAIARDLKRFHYEQLIRRVCTTVEMTVPEGAIVLVVSKGDQRLIDFHGRTGWHYPGNEKGGYAGHYPADSAAAIEGLERLRANGAGYLVIPEVALWWLDHYVAFREQLDRHCRVVFRHERTGLIYALGPWTGSGSSRAKSRVGSAEARR